MDKIKDEKSIKRKLNKYSGPCHHKDGWYIWTLSLWCETNSFRLFTRGNGTYNLDISWMIDYLNLPKIKNLTVRELIIKKQAFMININKILLIHLTVSGVANSKNIDPEIVEI